MNDDVAERLSPAHYVPATIPAAVRDFAGSPDTLAVGHPGKVGLLELGFERIGARTELVRRYQKSPLQIMRPLYVDPSRPDLPVVYLMSTGGGVVQADRLRLDVDCGADTAVHLTTQAATKVHHMDADFATQTVWLRVGPRAYLEYLPDALIPYPGARFYQRTTVTVDTTATVLVACLAASILDQDAAHGLGGGTQKMPAIGPATFNAAGMIVHMDEAQIGFMNHCRSV